MSVLRSAAVVRIRPSTAELSRLSSHSNPPSGDLGVGKGNTGSVPGPESHNNGYV